MNFNDENFDYDDYKKRFFRALKTPPVLLSIGVAVVGIVMSIVAGLFDGRIKTIIMLAGYAVTISSAELIRRNIFSNMGSNDEEKN